MIKFTLGATIAALSIGSHVLGGNVFNPLPWTLGNFADGNASPQVSVGTALPILSPFGVFGNGSVTPMVMTVTGGNAGKKGITVFSADAMIGGTVTFQWTYQSFDMPCYDNGGYFINDQFTVIACNQSGPLGGFDTFTVESGDTFGFGVRTGDGLEGAGTFKVLDFAFSGVMGPAEIGDLDGDGLVNGADLGILLSEWGQVESSSDLDRNGVVDGADLGMLLAQWS